MKSKISLSLSTLPEALAVCRLEPASAIPAWATTGPFFSVSRTSDELSVVCVQSAVPVGIRCEKEWRAFKVQGPLDFGLTGILAALTTPLADAGISIFAVSTFDTDYLLVRHADFIAASEVLTRAGHTVKG